MWKQWAAAEQSSEWLSICRNLETHREATASVVVTAAPTYQHSENTGSRDRNEGGTCGVSNQDQTKTETNDQYLF